MLAPYYYAFTYSPVVLNFKRLKISISAFFTTVLYALHDESHVLWQKRILWSLVLIISINHFDLISKY